MEAWTGQTLLGLPGPANASRDTFEHAILADGNRLSTLQGFIRDTGDDYSLLFVGRVYVDGVLECEQHLVLDRPPSSDPADILFAASCYQVYSGTIVPCALPLVNPFTFVGCYGTTAEITMAGYASTGLTPDLWEITATVQSVEPALNIALVIKRGATEFPRSTKAIQITYSSTGAGARTRYFVAWSIYEYLQRTATSINYIA